MHRVIIAVDFSETSMNAARYAADMLSGQKDTIALLYHNYLHPHDCDNCISYLESLKKEFLDKGVTTVEYENEMGGHFVDNLERMAQNHRATSVVMGINGHSALKEALIGSHTLEMIERSFCPVLIVPADAKFQGIKNVAFASEFLNVEMTTPTQFIKSVLDLFNPFLHIVNVNNEHYVALNDAFRTERAKMDELFKDYKHEFYFIGMYDFYDAIENFIRDYKIDMLITVPKYHKSMKNIFKKTHTQKLAYHTTIPILAVHQ